MNLAEDWELAACLANCRALGNVRKELYLKEPANRTKDAMVLETPKNAITSKKFASALVLELILGLVLVVVVE